MRLTQSNHTLQLTCRGCNSLFLGPGVDTCFTHLDVGCDQRVGGSFSEDWVDLSPGVGDVRCQRLDWLGYVSARHILVSRKDQGDLQ